MDPVVRRGGCQAGAAAAPALGSRPAEPGALERQKIPAHGLHDGHGAAPTSPLTPAGWQLSQAGT